MFGSLIRVGRRMLEPVPALDNAVQAALLATALGCGGTVLGVKVSGWLGLARAFRALLGLALRAALLLQREPDTQPRLHRSLDQDRAYSLMWGEGLLHRDREGCYSRVVVT